ncbi:MAG: flagellar biosynthesis regulator FlaF [Pseudomonadota bacterium]
MGNSGDAVSGYAAVSGATDAPRDAEAKIFARVISTLKVAATKSKDGDVKSLAEAIHLNARLWVALMTDLVQEGNKLPAELKVRLLELGKFSLAHGQKVLNNEGEIQQLIDVNTSVMRGLRNKPADSEATS